MGSTPSKVPDGTLSIALENQTSSQTVFAYITGTALTNPSQLFLLQSDGHTPYYPVSPTATGQPLLANCGIKLGPPGSRTTVQIPHLAGARIWFSINAPLTFLLNPGPGLVEPSVSNVSDPNYSILWGFCEFTFNTSELFVNISYVDFVAVPIALKVLSTAGVTQSVTGIPADGLQRVATALAAQGGDWARLVVRTATGTVLRALSPNTGIVLFPGLFQGFYEGYVDQVWRKYVGGSSLKINTQAQWGTVAGSVDAAGKLVFPGVDGGGFGRPSTGDVFSCSTGPFSGGDNGVRGNVGARIAAGLNRSTLLADGVHPDVDSVGSYYQGSVTNHYARILHQTNTDGRGYAFPYDDVGGGGQDQSGSLSDGSPSLLTVTVGGGNYAASRRVGLVRRLLGKLTRGKGTGK